ncbi:Clan CA, family C19, ubiquitin hydrolase-like cysteine peptidase [Trichomonas vaginalis G3]|uniref:Clan CA, family C19, ubiquitin hydrolase-like cysteine peptidase n=1 Tax=Trichomonas vaginalis (strain ATCC PRA-98 / G3) TaxID=412133 RepID=A2DAL7_TRIV3|nr:ubiquitinyl hydrolase protein [Trichomonas vaginalis G3]EAY22520.1 Clan CA, family C19, ubiquitin hydrolase-like cysteine peptidase [Trichomonas vaginalis G3]KAI5497253.1 ubiquitinyl hydrolase protein [Trichomonas vaginalis G3]|eukprot:XP_001583506.1 Clan CA, family C19, ubiquitin hydrolase-like cysteine peptidase [Trichomonas vaginalis G3]
MASKLMIPPPEKDFEVWATFITENVGQNDVFILQLPPLKKLVADYYNNKSLSGKLQNVSNRFIGEILPTICKKILQISIWKKYNMIITEILQGVCKIIYKYHEKLSDELISTLISILYPGYPYYFTANEFTHEKLDKWIIVVGYLFDDQRALDLIVNFYAKNTNLLNFENCSVIFTAFQRYFDIYSSLYSKNYEKILNYYIENIKTMKSTENNSFQVSLESFLQCICYKSSLAIFIIPNLLKLSTEQLKSDKLEENVNGIIMVKEIICNKKIFMMDFDEKINFVKGLIKLDLHEKTLIYLSQIITTLAKYFTSCSDLDTQCKYDIWQIIEILWEKTKTVHFSLQSKYTEILGKTFAIVGETKTKTWIERLEDNPLIVNVLTYSAININKPDDFLDMILTQKQHMKNVVVELTSNLVKKIQNNIAIKTANMFSIDPCVEYAQILIHTFNTCHESATTSILEQISDTINKINDEIPIYDLIFTILVSMEKPLDVTILNKFLQEEPKSEFWEFLNKLLEKNGKSSLSDESFAKIKDFLVNDGYFSNTKEFMGFLKNIIIIIGIDNKLILSNAFASKTIPKKIELKSFDIPGMQIIFKALDNDKSDQSPAFDTLLFFLDNCSVRIIKEVCDKLLILLKESPESRKIVYFKLIQIFIDKYEENDNLFSEKTYRHGDILLPCSNNYKVNLKYNETLYPLVLSQEELKYKTAYLLDKFSAYYPIDFEKNSNVKINSLTMNPANLLLDYISKNDVIVTVDSLKIHDYNFVSSDEVPSIIFFEKNLTSFIKDFLHNNSNLSKSDKLTLKGLLQKLPDDEEYRGLLVTYPDVLMTYFSSETSQILAEYILEILSFRVLKENIRDRFVSIDGIKILFDKINEPDFKSILAKAFSILSNMPENELVTYTEQIFDLIATNIVNIKQENRDIAIVLICKLDLSKIESKFLENNNILNNIFEKCPFNYHLKLSTYISKFTCNEELINYSKMRIKESQKPYFYYPIYSMSCSLSKNDSDAIECYEMLMNEINSAKHYSIYSLQFVLEKVLKISNNPEDVIKRCFETTKLCDDEKTMIKIFNRLKNISDKETLKKCADEFVSELLMNSYEFTNKTRSIYGTGLKNLGATCYMNSTIQQLFGLAPFLERFLQEKYEEDNSMYDLQLLFSSLLLTRRPFSNPKSFASKWKGWGNKTIKFGEEQDASEFLSMLLDGFTDDVKEMFTGQFFNEFKSEENEVVSKNFESFRLFSVDVSRNTNLIDSFNEMKTPEHFENYKLENGREIPVNKFTKIQKAPTVLIVHLRRLVYDYTKMQRQKINNKFIFPDDLDIADFVVENEDCKYDLKGVICHKGTAESGHYFSFCKKSDKKDYIKYDDMEVTKEDKNSFHSSADGTGKGETSSAYILFYTKKKFEKDFFDTKSDICKFVPEIFVEEIKKDNSLFLSSQLAFSKPLFDLVLHLCDLKIFMKYLCEIFVKSNFEEFIPALDNKIGSLNEEEIDQMGEVMADEIQNIARIITSPSDEKIPQFIRKILKFVIEESTLQNSLKIFSQIVDIFSKCVSAWYSYQSIGLLLHSYTQKGRKYILALDDETISKLLNSILMIYENDHPESILKSIDISEILSAMTDICSFKVKREFSQLLDLENKIKSGSNTQKIVFQRLKKILIQNQEKIQEEFNVYDLKTDSELISLFSNENSMQRITYTLLIDLSNKETFDKAKEYFYDHLEPFIKYLNQKRSDNIKNYSQRIFQRLFPNYSNNYFNPVPCDNLENNDEAAKIIKTIVKVAKKSISELLFIVLFWLVVSSNNYDFDFFSILMMIITSLENDKKFEFCLQFAMKLIEQNKFDKERVIKFRNDINNLALSTQCGQKINPMLVCLCLFFEPEELIVYLKNYKSKIINGIFNMISKQNIYSDISYKLILLFIDLKENHGFDDSDFMKKLFAQNVTTIDHLTRSYPLFDKVAAITGNLYLAQTLIKYVNGLLSKSNAVECVCKIFDFIRPPLHPKDVFPSNSYDFMAKLNDAIPAIQISFCDMIASFCIANKPTFLHTMKEKSNQYKLNFLKCRLALIEENEVALLDSIKTDNAKLKIQILSHCVDEFKDSWLQMIGIELLYLATFEPQECSLFWSRVIDSLGDEWPKAVDNLVNRLKRKGMNEISPDQYNLMKLLISKYEITYDQIFDILQKNGISELEINSIESLLKNCMK